VINLGDNKNMEISEDITLYGEAVPSTFQWTTIDKQKKRVREHEKIDNNKKKK
jgi:metal-dependent amidase/aminoacylase/carboxypeptidase family protein